MTLRLGVACLRERMLRTSYTSPSSSSPCTWCRKERHCPVHLLVRAEQMKHLGAVNEIVDFLHEVVKKDGLAEAEAEVADLSGKSAQTGEVGQLRAMREILKKTGINKFGCVQELCSSFS